MKRSRPDILVAIGIVILIGLVFLGAKYGPGILDNNQPAPQVGNNQSADPDDNKPPVDQPDPEPKDPNPPSQIPVTPNEPENPTGLSNKKLGWYFIANNQHQVPGIPDAARFITKSGGMYVGDTTRKVVYMTFDEGYENGYTASILDDLRNNQVKASFFVTKSYIDKNPDLVKRMVAEGHYVCTIPQPIPVCLVYRIPR
jgi:peptidoglycan-N-acetylmuramic acid deacetylase